MENCLDSAHVHGVTCNPRTLLPSRPFNHSRKVRRLACWAEQNVARQALKAGFFFISLVQLTHVLKGKGANRFCIQDIGKGAAQAAIAGCISLSALLGPCLPAEAVLNSPNASIAR